MGRRSDNIQYRNDRAGLIFLFSIISLIFLADFFIEISKTGLFESESQSFKWSKYELSAELNNPSEEYSVYADNYVVFRKENHQEDIQSVKKVSLFFFLLASFAFFMPVFKPEKENGKYFFFPDIKFILFPKSKYALPRPPPEIYES